MGTPGNVGKEQGAGPMAEKRLTEMSYAEFQGLMDSYIARSAQQDDAIPASTFLELLFDALARRVQNVVRLEGEAINGQS
jgi:hypothetical protein